MLVGRRRGRGVLRIDVRGVLEFGPRRQAHHLDDAGITHLVLHAEGFAHGAGDHLQLLLILRGKRDQHDEEADQQAHQVGERDEPTVAAAVCFFTPRHEILLP